jgi:hypothetical protein
MQKRVLVYLALVVAVVQQQAMVVMVLIVLLLAIVTPILEVTVSHVHLTVVHLCQMAASKLIVSM